MEKILSTPERETTRDRSFNFIRWAIFCVLILTYILVYFHRMAPGVVSQDLIAAFSISGTQLGALSSLYFFVYAFMQLPSGVIADTLGTRISIINGNIVAGAGSILFGLSGSFEMACLGRFLVGLGVSVVFVSIMKSNSVWFHERVFALLSGITLLVGNLGSVVAAGPLAAILTIYSWRSVFVGIGAVSLLLAAIGAMILANKPGDLGFQSPNNYTETAAEKASGNWLGSLLSILSTRRIWSGFWVQFGMIGSLYAFVGLWAVRYLQDVHAADRALAASHITVTLLCFAVGSLFWGWYSDRIRRRKPIIVGCVFGYLASWLLLIFIPWSPGILGMALFGFMGCMGAGFVVTFAIAKEVIHPDQSGMAVSVVNTGCFIGTALMQPLFGYIMDQLWDNTMIDNIRVYSAGDYLNGFYLMLVFSVIAVVGALFIPETRGRNIVVDNLN